MPRKALIKSDCFPYHITNRTRDRCFYQIDLDAVWRIYVDNLKIITWAYGVEIHAFVLMSNHYHLLASTPHCNIDEAVCFFQSQVSTEIAKQVENSQNYFATRYRWTLVKNSTYFLNVYRYIYQNPLRAGIAKTLADYPYSSFHGKAGYSRHEVPLSQHPFQFDIGMDCEDGEEAWLGECLESDQLDLIRKGLRRYEFALPAKQASKLRNSFPKR